ncbi:hypothetical protein D3C80_465040 [compost metagenome]
MFDEFVIQPALETPAEDIRIKEIPAVPRQHARADFCLCFDQPFGGKRLHRLAQNGAGDAETTRKLRIAGQERAFRYLAGDDTAPELGDHMGVVAAPLPAADGRFQKTQNQTSFNCRTASRRSEYQMMVRCNTMNINNRMPMTIFVHQEDNVPSKTM